MPHVGICAGGAGQLASLPRPLLGSNPSADSGAKTRLGFGENIPDPSSDFIHWDWHQSDKSQGYGDVRPRRLDGLVD
jgi:hypothetical protein